jgi:hypothetical protein
VPVGEISFAVFIFMTKLNVELGPKKDVGRPCWGGERAYETMPSITGKSSLEVSVWVSSMPSGTTDSIVPGSCGASAVLEGGWSADSS